MQSEERAAGVARRPLVPPALGIGPMFAWLAREVEDRLAVPEADGAHHVGEGDDAEALVVRFEVGKVESWALAQCLRHEELSDEEYGKACGGACIVELLVVEVEDRVELRFEWDAFLAEESDLQTTRTMRNETRERNERTHGLKKVRVGLSEQATVRGGVVRLLRASAVEKNDSGHRSFPKLERVGRVRHLLDNNVADGLQDGTEEAAVEARVWGAARSQSLNARSLEEKERTKRRCIPENVDLQSSRNEAPNLLNLLILVLLLYRNESSFRRNEAFVLLLRRSPQPTLFDHFHPHPQRHSRVVKADSFWNGLGERGWWRAEVGRRRETLRWLKAVGVLESGGVGRVGDRRG